LPRKHENILTDIYQPNIVILEKVFCSPNNMYVICHTIFLPCPPTHSTISYIFEELFTAGDLYGYLEFRRLELHETEVALILVQILKAVEYLHDHNIVHRDLKLENIMMTSRHAASRIVVSDFGSSRVIPSYRYPNGTVCDDRMESCVGTTNYQAP
jgi:pheromone a factor receptor